MKRTYNWNQQKGSKKKIDNLHFCLTWFRLFLTYSYIKKNNEGKKKICKSVSPGMWPDSMETD